MFVCKDFAEEWDGKEGDGEKSIGSIEEPVAGVVQELEEESDPRINRRKRQAVLPFYPSLSTRRGRSRIRRLV